jgi:hypothetical protein
MSVTIEYHNFLLAKFSLPYTLTFQFFWVLSSSHNLQTFFHPTRRHFLNTCFYSSSSFAARSSSWAALKSSIGAIACMLRSLYNLKKAHTPLKEKAFKIDVIE